MNLYKNIKNNLKESEGITAEVTYHDEDGTRDFTAGKLSDGRYFLIGQQEQIVVSDKNLPDLAKKDMDNFRYDEEDGDKEFIEALENGTTLDKKSDLAKIIINASMKYLEDGCYLLQESQENLEELDNKENLEESATEDYWDATELDRVGFYALLKFNHPEEHMNPSIQYIITNDNNEVYRFAMNGSDEKTKDIGAKIEFRRYINKEESENNKDKSIYGTKKELFEKFPELKNNKNYDSYADDDYMAIDFDSNNKIKGIRLATKDVNESEKNLKESFDEILPESKYNDMSDEELDAYVEFLKEDMPYHTHKKQEEMLKEIQKISKILTDRGFYVDMSNPDSNTIKFDDQGNEIKTK